MMPQTVKCKWISFSYKFYRICEMAFCTKSKYEFKNNNSIFIITNHKNTEHSHDCERATGRFTKQWQMAVLPTDKI